MPGHDDVLRKKFNLQDDAIEDIKQQTSVSLQSNNRFCIHSCYIDFISFICKVAIRLFFTFLSV